MPSGRKGAKKKEAGPRGDNGFQAEQNGSLEPNSSTEAKKPTSHRRQKKQLAAQQKARDREAVQIGAQLMQQKNDDLTSVKEEVTPVPKPPKVDFSRIPKEIIVKKGEKIEIDVPFVGTPHPEAQWARDGKPLSDRDTDIETKDKNSKLCIPHSERSDAGLYELTLTNEVGTEKVPVNVNVKDKPVKPKGPLDIVDVYCDRCALLWDKPDNDGGCPITGYVVEMSENGQDWKKVCDIDDVKIDVADLKLHNRYTFRVAAVNEMGQGDWLDADGECVAKDPWESTEDSGLANRLNKLAYKNWLKAGLCLKSVKNGIETFAEERSQRCHDHVKDQLASAANPSLDAICGGAKISYCKPTWKMSCCNNCQQYVDEIIKMQHLTFKFSKSNWRNSDIQLWPSHPWEMMKVFMNAGQELTQKSPKDTDLSGILNFIDHCVVARNDISLPFNISKVRDARNAVMHSAELELSDDEFRKHTTAMIDLLQDPLFLCKMPDAKDNIHKIQELQTLDFCITADAELKVIDDRTTYLLKQNEAHKKETETSDREKEAESLRRSFSTLRKLVDSDRYLHQEMGHKLSRVEQSLSRVEQSMKGELTTLKKEVEQLKDGNTSSPVIQQTINVVRDQIEIIDERNLCDDRNNSSSVVQETLHIRGDAVRMRDEHTYSKRSEFYNEEFPSLETRYDDNDSPSKLDLEDLMALDTEKTTTKPGESSPSGMPSLINRPIRMTYSQITQTQNIEAKNVIIKHTNGSKKVSRAAQAIPFNIQESQINEFLSAVTQFKSGHFILVTCRLDQNTDVQSIQNIGHVPWMAVFDFDQNSSSDGLLSQAEIPIMGKRSLHIKTWQDKVVFNEESTNWILMRGLKEQPETLTDDKFQRWKYKTKSGLDHIMHQMKRFGGAYAKYVVVVLWPSDNKFVKHVKHLLDALEVLDICNFVIVVSKEEEPIDNELEQMQEDYDREPSIVRMPITNMFLAIKRVFRNSNQHKPTRFDLPRSNQTPIGIKDRDAQWLKEDLEVLYLKSPYEYENTHDKLQEEKRQFYMGGNWPWYMWYAVGGNYVDIERDVMKNIKSSLTENHIEVFKSGRVTIFHAPGSGGTTLAQRILWDLHKITPCVHLKLRTGSAEVASRLQFIYDKTRLPVLILLDGEDEQRVDLLVQDLKEICYVILHVKRYPYPITNRDTSKKVFWLTRYVSKEEAVTIADRFLQQCDTQAKRSQVKCLQREVETGQATHGIFEFGLATYHHQYKGIESYVNGFLQLDCTSDEPLEPWQNALGILSLVYYYGQMAIPCKFFETVLKDRPEILTVDNFPLEMEGLIMRDTNDGRANVVRVSHYLVAKEILEQILSRPLDRGVRVEGLCITATRKLERYASSFIEMAANATTEKSGIMEKIMKNTFISRNNRFVGETDLVDKPGKPRFAQILHDVTSRAPYTARFRILKKLTRSFPREPQFQAHLGRLYSLCQPEKEEKAEQCFKRALEICEKEKGGLSIDDLPNNLKRALMHIYHMYGSMFLESISNYTGKFFGDQPKQKVFEDTAEQVLKTLFPKVQAASFYFTQCREVTPQGSEESYGFLGEIKIRLMFCDFVNRNIANGELYKFINSKQYSEIAAFVEDTITVVADLVLECLSVVDPDKTEGQLASYQKWYAGLFEIRNVGNVVFRTNDEVKSKRLLITATKLIYQKKKVSGVLEEVTNRVHIEEIVKHYEAIFKDVHENGIHSPRRLIDLDYREWIFAIRDTLLKKKYSLPDVLQRVELWHEKINTPSSRFYLFILYSLIGFSGNSELLIKAQEVKQELLKQSKYVTKPRYPREWLGEGPGIRCLTPGTCFFGKIEGREIKGHFDSSSLKHMFGTVCSPNEQPATGYIRLDLSKESPISIIVFYVPVRSNMRGSAYVDRRVEFYLGFSMAHGYEAYNVRELQEIQCKKCYLYSWIRPNSNAKCKCGELLVLGS